MFKKENNLIRTAINEISPYVTLPKSKTLTDNVNEKQENNTDTNGNRLCESNTKDCIKSNKDHNIYIAKNSDQQSVIEMKVNEKKSTCVTLPKSKTLTDNINEKQEKSADQHSAIEIKN